MYGRFGRLLAQPGRRAEFTAILLRAAQLVSALPGCRQYLVAEDPADDAAICVFELWDNAAAHAASLQAEPVRALIGEARPLMAGAAGGAELRVVGGHGLPR